MVECANVVRRLFTVEEYHEMGRAGILTEEDRVELIEGEIYRMSPIGKRHAATVDCLNDLLTNRLRGRGIVRVQNPIRLGNRSELQPDIAVLKPVSDYYASALPGPEDVLFLIEVAETSTETDRDLKLPLYAKAGVPEVWIVDLAADRIETYLDPQGDAYGCVERKTRGERFSPSAFPDVAFGVEEILIG